MREISKKQLSGRDEGQLSLEQRVGRVEAVHLLSGPFPTLATLLHLVENHNAQNPLLSGFWAWGCLLSAKHRHERRRQERRADRIASPHSVLVPWVATVN